MKQSVVVGQNEAAMSGMPIMTGTKGLTCALSPCGCCCNPYLDLTTGDNLPLGKVTVPFFCCIPAYKIADAQGQPEYEIHQPTCCCGMCINICSGGCCNCRIPYHIYTPGQADKGKGKELGIVEKQWRGLGTEMFSDADTFTINFPKDADPDSKARILGFAFLLNMMEFEKPQKQ